MLGTSPAASVSVRLEDSSERLLSCAQQLLYVDDILIVGQDMSKIDRLKKELSKFFATKDLESSQKILGMKISHHKMPFVTVKIR